MELSAPLYASSNLQEPWNNNSGFFKDMFEKWQDFFQKWSWAASDSNAGKNAWNCAQILHDHVFYKFYFCLFFIIFYNMIKVT